MWSGCHGICTRCRFLAGWCAWIDRDRAQTRARTPGRRRSLQHADGASVTQDLTLIQNEPAAQFDVPVVVISVSEIDGNVVDVVVLDRARLLRAQREARRCARVARSRGATTAIDMMLTGRAPGWRSMCGSLSRVSRQHVRTKTRSRSPRRRRCAASRARTSSDSDGEGEPPRRRALSSTGGALC